MARLRPALNKGGKDHFIPANRKRPFLPERIYNEDGTWEDKSEMSYPLLEHVNNGPMFETMVLMAFEKALESGGWRAECFRTWFTRNIMEMKVELVQTIEGRLYPVMQKTNGHIITERDYHDWHNFLDSLRKYLYGI